VDRLIALFPRWVKPNHLTFLRLGLSLFMLVLEFGGGDLGLIILCGLAAGFSDLLDGALARRRGLTTALGAFLDPVGDKLFALVMAVILWHRSLVAAWLLLSLLVTEVHTVLVPLLVMARRLARRRPLWPPPQVVPNRWGKLKTGWLAASLGLVAIAHWMGQGWLVQFAVWNIYLGLALGLVAEVKYLADWYRGAYE